MPTLTRDSNAHPNEVRRRLARIEAQKRGIKPKRTEVETVGLAGFVEETTRFALEPWQHKICRRLERLPGEKGARILLHGPPQFGKSIIASQRFPAYTIGKDPAHRFRLACYNETHAERFSRVNLAVMRDPVYAAMFPDVGLPPPNASAKEWYTTQRLAMRDGQPSFVALGIGSGFVGMGADTLGVDDPYKNREEAFSDTTNENVWLWWSDVVLPRLNPDTNVFVMFHRWKSNDLAGRLYDQGGWELMRFPAIADGLVGDCSELPPGESLSKRFSIPFLRNVESQQGSLAFNALYQGNPGDAAGNLIKADYFRPYWLADGFYHLQRGDRVERVRASDVWRFVTVDWASSDAKTADWTVATTWGVTPRNDLLTLNVKRGREEGPEAKSLVRDELRMWEPTFVVVEKNGLGLPMTQDLQREGWPIRGVWQHTAKPVRAQSLAVAYENGRIFHPREAEWLAAWTKELLAFPAGANDDQLDTGSLAARAITGSNAVIHDFSQSLHVSLDPLTFDPKAQLYAGWSMEPVPAFVVGQFAGAQLMIYLAETGNVGEGLDAFVVRMAARMAEEFCDSEGRSKVEALPLRCYGPEKWLGGVGGQVAGTFASVARNMIPGPVRVPEDDLREAIRLRCNYTPGGLPSLLIDPEATELIAALSGGYSYKVAPNGLPTPEIEKNAAKGLCEALGMICVMRASVKKAGQHPALMAASGRGQPAGRAAGGRGRR